MSSTKELYRRVAWIQLRRSPFLFCIGAEDDSHGISSFVVNDLRCKWLQVGEFAEVGPSEDVARDGRDVAVVHVDMGPDFWRKHPYIFNR
jgi:hypothetical protein